MFFCSGLKWVKKNSTFTDPLHGRPPLSVPDLHTSHILGIASTLHCNPQPMWQNRVREASKSSVSHQICTSLRKKSFTDWCLTSVTLPTFPHHGSMLVDSQKTPPPLLILELRRRRGSATWGENAKEPTRSSPRACRRKSWKRGGWKECNMHSCWFTVCVTHSPWKP